MKTITITRNCAIAGAHVEVGAVLIVGQDVTEADAKAVIQLRRAVEGGEAKAPRKRKSKADGAPDGDTGAEGQDGKTDGGTGADASGNAAGEEGQGA